MTEIGPADWWFEGTFTVRMTISSDDKLLISGFCGARGLNFAHLLSSHQSKARGGWTAALVLCGGNGAFWSVAGC